MFVGHRQCGYSGCRYRAGASGSTGPNQSVLATLAPPGDHHAGACYKKHDAYCDRDSLAMLGADAYVDVARTYPMIFRVAYRNEKGKNSEEQYC
jgi:hypothetical protein